MKIPPKTGHERAKVRARALRKRGPSKDVDASVNPLETFGGISIGDRFGSLTVVRRAENKGQHAYWECVCECPSVCLCSYECDCEPKPVHARTIVVRGDHLRDGSTLSCGCAHSCYQETRITEVEKKLRLKNFGKVFVLGTAREFMGVKQIHAVTACRYCGVVKIQRGSDVLRKNFRGCDCAYIGTIEKRVREYGWPPPWPVKQREQTEVTLMRGEWRSMIARCHDPKNRDYAGWGGRGIYVCERWRNSFEAFLADNGVRPLEMSLERKDNAGPYSPENCKWGTRREQNRNRRSTIVLEYLGERLTLAELASRLGITYAQAYRHYRTRRSADEIAAWAHTRVTGKYAVPPLDSTAIRAD